MSKCFKIVSNLDAGKEMQFKAGQIVSGEKAQDLKEACGKDFDALVKEGIISHHEEPKAEPVVEPAIEPVVEPAPEAQAEEPKAKPSHFGKPNKKAH